MTHKEQPFKSPQLFASTTKSVDITEKSNDVHHKNQCENRKGRWTVRESEMQTAAGGQLEYCTQQLPSSWYILTWCIGIAMSDLKGFN